MLHDSVGPLIFRLAYKGAYLGENEYYGRAVLPSARESFARAINPARSVRPHPPETFMRKEDAHNVINALRDHGRA